MLECYLDDSKDDKAHRYCASGGLIGGAEQWDAFVVMWSHKTHELKEPFRSTDCECGHGQFKDWPIPKRNKLMADLVSVIRSAKLPSIASIVPVQAYRKAFPNSKAEDPYLLTIPHAIMNMAYISEQKGIDLSYWFESGSHNAKIHAIFDSVSNLSSWKPSQRIRSIAFDSKKLYPLQSADLIAREAFKRLDNLGARPIRKSLRGLGTHAFFIAWTEETLQYLAAHGGPENLELLSSWESNPHAPKFSWYSLWLEAVPK